MEDLVVLLERELATVPASRNARAYILGLFGDQASSRRIVDFSRESVVLAFLRTLERETFEEAQRLADWALWILSWFPESAREHREVVETLGRLNYYACYRRLRSWVVYEELADTLPVLTRHIHGRVRHLRGGGESECVRSVLLPTTPSGPLRR